MDGWVDPKLNCVFSTANLLLTVDHYTKEVCAVVYDVLIFCDGSLGET